MRLFPRLALLGIVGLAGCAQSNVRAYRDDGFNPAAFHRIGVKAFIDARGQGPQIAEAIDAGLQKLFYEPVDRKAVERVLAQLKPGRDSGFGLEVLETLRRETSADAILSGRMAPDWSAVSISMIDTEMGSEVLRAVIKPPNKRKKSFASPAEVAEQVLLVITSEG